MQAGERIMSSEIYDRAEFLKSLAKNKKKETYKRVVSVFTDMKKNGIPITFQSVARIANVSKTWLYNNESIALQIRNYRDKSESIKKALDINTVIKNKDEEIATLNSKVSSMVCEIKALKIQLESVYAEIYRASSKIN